MVELQITLRDVDPAYTEEHVGLGLYAHLRAVPAIATHRRRALARAHRLYQDVTPGDEARRGAMGLLVLQRTMLAVEDLGGLLYALEPPVEFGRLVSYRLEDLTTQFDRLSRDRAAVPRLYRLPSAHALEVLSGADQAQRTALLRLRTLSLSHIRQLLGLAARFWRNLRADAKKTMHGIGFVAGCRALESPHAGGMAGFVPPGCPRPFAIALDTTIDHSGRQAQTTVGIVDLSLPAIESMREAGHAALQAIEILAAGQLRALQTRGALAMPDDFLPFLEAADRDAIGPILRDVG